MYNEDLILFHCNLLRRLKLNVSQTLSPAADLRHWQWCLCFGFPYRWQPATIRFAVSPEAAKEHRRSDCI